MAMMKTFREWLPPLFHPIPKGDVVNISGSYATVKKPDGTTEVIKVEAIARRLRPSERGDGGSGTVVSWFNDGVENMAVVRSDELKYGKPEYLLIPESWLMNEDKAAIEAK